MCSIIFCADQSPLTGLCYHTAPQTEGEASVTTTSRCEVIKPNEMPLARHVSSLHGRSVLLCCSQVGASQSSRYGKICIPLDRIGAKVACLHLVKTRLGIEQMGAT